MKTYFSILLTLSQQYYIHEHLTSLYINFVRQNFRHLKGFIGQKSLSTSNILLLCEELL